MVLIPVTRSISIDSDEIEESFTRASGPGGQHVNTTDSAVLLRFNVWTSPNLPDMVKHRLSDLAGSRLTNDGVLVLRSEGARSQLMNRTEVRERLIAMIKEATIIPKKRKPTRPSKTAKAKRMDGKAKRSTVKNLRGKIRD
jgi:ribosome-associated protein